MDKDLKQRLQRITKGHRPRPLMYIGRHNGKKCYVRKKDLTYWKLLEKYPPPFDLKKALKPRHIFQRQHHLKPKHLRTPWAQYAIFGSIAAFVIFAVIFYLTLLIGELL